jgi:hypothetical protein
MGDSRLRRTSTLIAAAVFACVSLAPMARADDRADVQAVVDAAYVQGVHAAFNADAMRKGFHPEFRMYVLRDGAVSVVTRDEWIARMEKAPAPAA